MFCGFNLCGAKSGFKEQTVCSHLSIPWPVVHVFSKIKQNKHRPEFVLIIKYNNRLVSWFYFHKVFIKFYFSKYKNRSIKYFTNSLTE